MRVGGCVGVCVCFYLLHSCHLQYFLEGWNVLTKFDQGDEAYNWSEDIQFGHPCLRAHKSHSLSQGKHQRGEWRVHLRSSQDCGIILSNKYWFRGNKRTWQKLTASSMVLTLLSLIGHSTLPAPPCCTPRRYQGIEYLWIKQTHIHTHLTHTVTSVD